MSETYSVEAVLKAKVDDFVNGFKQAKSSAEDFMSKNQQTFDSFKQVGAAATAGGVAIGAALGGAVKVAADFESGMSNVQAVSGASAQDMELLSEKAREMGSSTKFSASEASDGLSYMALAGWDTQQMMEGIGPTLDLAAASGMDLARTSDIVTDAMSMFSMEAEEAGRMSDVLAAASSKTNTDVDQLGEALKYAGANAAAAGMDIEQTSAFLGLLADNGLKGSVAGTTLNAILRDLKGNAEDGALAVGEQSVALYDAQGNMRDMTDVMDDLINATAHMSDEQRDQAVSSILGQEALKGFNIYASEGAGAVGALEEELRNSKGAANEMSEIMQDNLNGSLTNLKSALEEVMIALGTALIPVVEKAVELAQMLADKFNSLDEKTQTIIAVIAALSAGFLLLVGPILMLIGFIPSILAGFAALSTVIGAVATALTVLTGPIGLVIAGVAAIGVGAVALGKHLSKDALPEVERFGEGVSESTQEAVGAFMDMSDEADVALKEVVWSQQEMNKELAKDMIASQQEITDTLLSAIDERHEEEIEATKEQFEHIDALSEEQKAKVIESTNERFESEAETVEEGNQRINDIYETAAEEKRAITEAESNEILSIRENMTEQAIEVMSENEEEQRMIYERMKDNASELSALEAAEVVRNATEKKDAVIDEAEEQFTETRVWAEKQRDELGTLSEEEAQAIIDEAEKKRDETIAAAEETHDRVIDEAQSQADEHVNLVDWETGEIKSKWQVMKENITRKAGEIAKSVIKWFTTKYLQAKQKVEEMLSAVKTKYEEMKTTAKNKVEEMKTAVKDKYEEVKTTIKTKLTEAVKIVGEKIGEMPGKVKEFVGDMVSAGGDLVQGLIDGIVGMGKSAIEAITGVVGGVIKKAKSLLQTKSPSRVFMGIGSDTVKGFEVGAEARRKHAENSIKKVFDGVLDESKKAHKNEVAEVKKNNLEISKIEQRANEDIRLIKRKAAESKRKITEAESIRIRRIEEDSAKKIRDLREKNNKIELDMLKKQNDDLIKAANAYVEEKRWVGEMSLSDEIYFWNAMYKSADRGSAQYEEGMRNHQNAVKQLRSQVESINKEYNDKILRINEEFNTESQKLHDEYEKSYDAHLNKMLNFAGIFDEFNKKTDVTGRDLMHNLQDQVRALSEYDHVINQLGSRINNDALMDELKSLGVKAVGELEALNSLSDRELDHYVKMYETKFKIAKNHTDEEMKPMMKEIDNKLIALKRDTSKRLDEVNKEWQRKINQIVGGAESEFDSMRQVGIDAIKGLSDGMSSMSGQLMAQAKQIAEDVKKTMQGAFDIHSPSRWMRDMIGENMMIGWIDGIVGMESDVVKSLASITDSVKQSFSSDMPTNDFANQINEANKQAQFKVQSNLNNDLSVNKQPAVINVHVGGERIAQEIVDDISRYQGDRHATGRLHRGY